MSGQPRPPAGRTLSGPRNHKARSSPRGAGLATRIQRRGVGVPTPSARVDGARGDWGTDWTPSSQEGSLRPPVTGTLQPPSSRLKKALRDPGAVFTLHSHQRAALNADSRPSSTWWSQPSEGAGFCNRHLKHTTEAPSLSPMPGEPLFELQSLRLNAHEYGRGHRRPER